MSTPATIPSSITIPEKRKCRDCGEVKLYEEFALAGNKGRYAHNRRHTCKPCQSAKVNQLRKDTYHFCDGCMKQRPKNKFMVDGLFLRHCDNCREVEHQVFKKALDDILYDYSVARDLFQMNHRSALQWIARGYKKLSFDYIWDHWPHELAKESWEPMKIEEVEQRECRHCSSLLDITEFPNTVNKQGKEYRGWKCRDCLKAYNRERRRQKGIRWERRAKVRL